jgi:putative intracellular protease/amidase
MKTFSSRLLTGLQFLVPALLALASCSEDASPAAGAPPEGASVEVSSVVLDPVNKKQVLFVVASPTTHPTLQYPIGFWASELTHAYVALAEAGHDVVIASPAGGEVRVDGYSDPRDPSGYSAFDVTSLGFLSSAPTAALLTNTTPLAQIDAGAFDAIYVAGGQAPMFSFRENDDLQRLLREFYEAGKPTTLVCHGVSALLDVTLSDGSYLAAGKRITGFANSEEDYTDAVMKAKVMPFHIEDVARERGANFIAAPAFAPHAERDGNLITGQQQHSAAVAARFLLDALAR